MLFSSMSFIFLFLPIVCITYLLAKRKYHNSILLFASVIFYAWGEPKFLAIMLLTIILTYAGAMLIDKYPSKKKFFLILSILGNLSFLIYFKYFNFIIENINGIFSSNINAVNVILPIGISFYIFQAISYLIDIYRGDCKVQKDFYKLALYISLFPQLVAGPIIKYRDVENQIDHRIVSFDKVSEGVKRFIIGLAKKMLLANTMGAIADKIFSQPPDTFSPLTAWIGAIAYSFQLFFDFSGYSDMVIGLGLIFGFRFLENFNYPYISKSITEFWRRWHISLSTWFKEYLYIPLGGNRVTPQRTYINLFIVFLATGIWHGANWTFVVWGLWHGTFIIFEKATGWHKETCGKLINFTKHIYTILIFIFGWVLFRSDSISYAAAYIKNMLGLLPVHDVKYALPYYVDNFEKIIFAAALVCSIPFFSKMLDITRKRKLLRAAVNVWLLLLFLISAAAVAASTYNPFIYFRF
jgi:Predicted membrane protein involved in D-alanine export